MLDLEKATLRGRYLLDSSFKKYHLGYKVHDFYNKVSQDVYKIKIENNDNILRITLPGTLPHYSNTYKSIIHGPLSSAFKYYQKTHKVPEYKSAVIVCVNHISQVSEKTRIRDNDNYEYKQLINTIAFWVLPDDGYKCCNMLNGVKLDTSDYTEVFVVPKDRFGQWYIECEADLFS